MERIISDEEKIRRAIEISQRRNKNYYKDTTTRVNVNEKKEYKLFKKMILQIIICLLIYIIFYLIFSTNYVFSAEVLKNVKAVLNYDINFNEIYNNLMLHTNKTVNENTNQLVEENNINIIEDTNQTINNKQTTQNNVVENIVSEINNVAIVEKNEEETDKSKITENEIKKEEKTETTEITKTQMELDVEAAKKVCKFEKPLTGTITSEFGEREATIEGMTTDHKGIDIAANKGTSIKAAISGTVKVAEENSEYGKFIKIVNGDVMTVYAHCQKLKVKVGDKVKTGQTIATVGSTGNSTGPHLHFEIRFENRFINPRSLIKF